MGRIAILDPAASGAARRSEGMGLMGRKVAEPGSGASAGAQELDRLVAVIARMRDACPWDKAQTLDDWKRELLGEMKELAQAMDRGDAEDIREELGDVIADALHIAESARRKRLFTLEEALRDVRLKLIRRHPHVFGKAKARTVQEAAKLYSEAKAGEKLAKKRNR